MHTARFLPPGPALPALLQGIQYAFRPGPFFETCARRYGECFTLRMPVGPPIEVMFSDPEAIRQIFTGNEDELRGGEAFIALQPLLGASSILALDGARHERERRLMMPPFHGERMLAYGDTMRAIVDRAIERWPIGRPFPIHPEMQAITLEVILRTVFGAEGERLDALRSLVQRLSRVMANPIWLWPRLQIDLGPLSPWGRFLRVKRDLDTFLFAEFARRRADGSTARDDVLSLLLAARYEDGEPMRDEELRDQMMTLLFAGLRCPQHPVSPGGPRAAARRARARRRRGAAGARARRKARVPRRHREGDAALEPDHLRGGARARPPDAHRRVGPARGCGGGTVHLPRPPASRCVARVRAFRPGAVYRPAAEPLRVLPFRRRCAPLPRDGVRALRDEGGAGGGGVARRAPPRDRVPHAARAAEHHARAVEGHAGGGRAAGRLRTIPAGTLLWRGRVRPAPLRAVRR